MQTIYRWTYTDPRTGKRVRSTYHMSADQAHKLLLKPERIECSDMVVPDAIEPIPSWTFVSGLFPTKNDD
jgi:hypothetical protein